MVCLEILVWVLSQVNTECNQDNKFRETRRSANATISGVWGLRNEFAEILGKALVFLKFMEKVIESTLSKC